MSSSYTPRLYQELIIRHIIEHERCAVFASMGSGKTSAVLYAIQQLKHQGQLNGRVLILAPLRVALTTWIDEVAKWCFDLTITTAAGSNKQRDIALAGDSDIVTINYESIPWLIQSCNRKWPFSMIVADESTRLKGFRARSGGLRARMLARVAFLSKRFVELTGTPAPRGVIDLWGQMFFLDKGKRLGSSLSSFLKAYFYPIRVGASPFAVRYELIPGKQEIVLQKLADICKTIDIKDYFDINEPITSKIEIALPNNARSVYDDLQKDMFAELSGEEINAVNAAAKTVKCLQVTSGAVYVGDQGDWLELHNQKLEALRSIVEEANGMPILVAYHWLSDAERLLKAFPGAKLLDKNPNTVRDWNEGKIAMLLCHPASAGHGLSLQDGGNILVFFSLWWDLEQHQQVIERIGPTRQMQAGHPRPVFVYHILAKDTLDEAVLERLEGKASVQEALLNFFGRQQPSISCAAQRYAHNSCIYNTQANDSAIECALPHI